MVTEEALGCPMIVGALDIIVVPNCGVVCMTELGSGVTVIGVPWTTIGDAASVEIVEPVSSWACELLQAMAAIAMAAMVGMIFLNRILESRWRDLVSDNGPCEMRSTADRN